MFSFIQALTGVDTYKAYAEFVNSNVFPVELVCQIGYNVASTILCCVLLAVFFSVYERRYYFAIYIVHLGVATACYNLVTAIRLNKDVIILVYDQLIKTELIKPIVVFVMLFTIASLVVALIYVTIFFIIITCILMKQ